jgi:hypothetical protein
MSYIGNSPSSIAFLTDTFSGNASATAFTLSAAPATTSSILVAVSGVLQDPSTYSSVGTTLTFSAAPPSGTDNISVRFLGIPASGVTTTAYRTVTEFTATASQTTFSVPSYTVGFIDVYRNGVMLGSADYTATNGTTVVLAVGATSGDLVEVISFQVSSVLNAIPASPASVQTSYLVDGSVTAAKLASGAALSNLGTAQLADANMPAGSVLQVVNATYSTETANSTSTYADTGLTASITPSSSSSKILVLVSQAGVGKSNDDSANGCTVNLLRSSTQLIEFVIGGGRTVSATYNLGLNATACYLDNPSTTSSTTYKTQFKNFTNAAAVYVQGNNATSTLTLMEIAA